MSIFYNIVDVKEITGVKYNKESRPILSNRKTRERKMGNIIIREGTNEIKVPTLIYKILAEKGLTKNNHNNDIESPEYYKLILGIIGLHTKTCESKNACKEIQANIKTTRKPKNYVYGEYLLNDILQFMLEDICEMTHCRRQKVAYYATIYANKYLLTNPDKYNLTELVANFDR